MKTEQSDDKILQSNDYKEWEEILKKFREWQPNCGQFEEMSGYFEDLVRLIMQE